MSAPDRRPRAVFLDFDGTITARDTFVGAVRRFAPVATAAILPEIVAGRDTLRRGLKEIVGAIPSRDLAAMIESIMDAPLRAGLEELLDFLDQSDAAAIVVSSGIDAMVRARLGDFANRFTAIYAARADDSAERLSLESDFESGDELVAKAAVLALHPAAEQVAVGDSITDRAMAAAATMVFARDRLIEHCRADGIPFIPWNDFHDVRRALEERWRNDERS